MLNLRGAGKYLLVSALALVTFVPLASAKKLKPEVPLYTFCAKANCSDGAASLGGLLMDSSGNVYGTTEQGGNTGCGAGCGTVFKVAPDGTETVLYSFCSQANCADGAEPEAGLIMDGAGNLYGTTLAGGNSGCSLTTNTCGTVFKLAPDGTETTLYSFCSQAGCADGANPHAGLVMDGAGNLYGTTEVGGANQGCVQVGASNGCGTVFEVTSGGTESVLYSFCSQASCADGSYPTGGLILDSSGNLYSTTSTGGTATFCQGGCGTVFEIAPGGTETVLYSFCSSGDCSGGAEPNSGVIMDSAGNLYGTANDHASVAYKLAPDGTETVLHTFTGGSDGIGTSTGLMMDGSGNLYGTTEFGGNTSCRKQVGCGTVYKLAPDGTETQIYVFKSGKGGRNPVSGVIADSQGNLYGTDINGGLTKYGTGVVFKINIAATANVKR
jgi:uncharacterized repeat protein (TIGR03803 family)